MITRVLYLLLRQRYQQWRSGTPTAETAPSLARRPHPPAAHAPPRKTRRLWPWPLALAAIAGTLLFAWLQVYHSDSRIFLGSDPAELVLEVAASKDWPLVVYLTGGDLRVPERQALPPDNPRIESINASFSPAFQVLPEASELEIVNSDPIPHNTHVFHHGETIFNVGLPTRGVTVRKTLTGTGIFSVRCDLHPAMQGWLFVPPSPHYAVLDGPQTIRFSGLAAGEYLLHLWQADGGERYRLISLTSGEKSTLHLR